MRKKYEKSVNELLKDFIENWTGNNGIFQKKDALDWFKKNYPKISERTVSAHIIKFSTNNKNRAHYHANPDGSHDILFKMNENTFRKYNSTTDPEPIYVLPTIGSEVGDGKDGDEIESGTTFAYEEHLKGYLVKNMETIEPGLKLYEEDGINGLEFDADGRFIDILAVDKDNNFVVIELKVSNGYDRVVGQLLRYKNWVKKELATNGQLVRGIIIAHEISKDLKIACMGLPNIKLFEYDLSVKLQSCVEYDF